MHHHYLSRSPWNADMKHVAGLRSWIIFGRQPEGICVESSSHCFLLLRTFCTNIYQFTNYWTRVCPGTYKHSVGGEPCVYVSTFLLNTLLFAICVRRKSASKHMWSRNTCGRVGCYSTLVCCFTSASDREEAVGNGTFVTWTLTLTWRQQAFRSIPREESFSSRSIKGSDCSVHANSMCTY